MFAEQKRWLCGLISPELGNAAHGAMPGGRQVGNYWVSPVLVVHVCAEVALNLFGIVVDAGNFTWTVNSQMLQLLCKYAYMFFLLWRE